MIKLMGAVLVTAGCGAVGLGAARHLDGRVMDLRELSAGLETLQRELCWRLAPLPEALKEAAGEAHGRAALFFDRCAQNASTLDGHSFQQIWQKELERCQLRLDGEDRSVLEQLGPVLGRYDADSQRQAIEAAAAGLSRRQAQAEEERGRLGRVYAVLGITAGMFLAILLI